MNTQLRKEMVRKLASQMNDVARLANRAQRYAQDYLETCTFDNIGRVHAYSDDPIAEVEAAGRKYKDMIELFRETVFILMLDKHGVQEISDYFDEIIAEARKNTSPMYANYFGE